MDLTDAYENGKYIPDADSYGPKWAAEAEAYRQRMAVLGRSRLGVMYGHGTREVLDLFMPDAVPVGLVVFVHGGYWRRFDRSSWSHLAEGAVGHGWAVAMPSYDLCPRVRISDITRQIAQAVSTIARDVKGPIRLMGHSAGGHLVARMPGRNVLAPDVLGRVEHIMPISPLSDLRPLLQTSMNADLQLTEEEAIAESPVLSARPKMPVTVWVGSDERPVFLDQAEWLAKAWGSGLLVDAGKHHFSVIEALARPDSPIVKTLLGLN